MAIPNHEQIIASLGKKNNIADKQTKQPLSSQKTLLPTHTEILASMNKAPTPVAPVPQSSPVSLSTPIASNIPVTRQTQQTQQPQNTSFLDKTKGAIEYGKNLAQEVGKAFPYGARQMVDKTKIGLGVGIDVLNRTGANPYLHGANFNSPEYKDLPSLSKAGVNEDLYNVLARTKSSVAKSNITTERFKKSILESGMQGVEKTEQEMNKNIGAIEDHGSFTENLKDPKWVGRMLSVNVPSFLVSLGIGATTTAISKNPVLGYAAGFAPSYLQNAGDVYGEAKNSGADEETAIKTANLVGTINGALDTIGISSILNKFGGDEAIGFTVKQILKNMAVSIPEEGITEGMQQVVQNSVAQVYYDHKRDVFAGVPESAFFGSIMGAGGSVATDIAMGSAQAYAKLPRDVKEGGYLSTDIYKTKIENSLQNAKTAEEGAQIIKQETDRIISTAKNPNDLKALKAALNKIVNEGVGTSGNWKQDYYIKNVEVFGNTDNLHLNEAVNQIERIDDILSKGNIKPKVDPTEAYRNSLQKKNALAKEARIAEYNKNRPSVVQANRTSYDDFIKGVEEFSAKEFKQPTLKVKTDPTEALKVEARKYKSAEEFVKSQKRKLPVRGEPVIGTEELSNNNLKLYLDDINSQQIQERIGKEVVKKRVNNVVVTKGEFGGGRYLYKDSNDRIIGALNYTGNSEKGFVLSNIYTSPNFRNKGIATKLLALAKKDMPNIEVDSSLTKEGADFLKVKTKSQLTDIWNKAQKTTPQAVATKTDEAKIDQYNKKYKDQLLNTDNVRELYTSEGYNRTNSAEFHKRSSKLANEIFKRQVAKLKPNDNYLFMAGASGTGKSTAISKYSDITSDLAGGLDGNFSSGSSLKKLNKVIKTGANVRIAFVYREPMDSWNNGVVSRAINPTNGRVVPLEVFLDNLEGSPKTVLKAHRRYGDKLDIQVIDNSKGKNNAVLVDYPIEFLEKIEYNMSDVKEKTRLYTESKIKDGTISEETGKALLGKETGKQPQQKRQKQQQPSVSSTTKETTSDSVIEDIKDGFEGGRKLRDSAQNDLKGTKSQRLRTELVDRLTPIFDFVNKAAKQLPTENNPYRKLRLLAGVSGKVEAFLETKVAPILKSEKDRQGDLSALLVLEREQELVVDRGLKRKRNIKQIEQGISELKAKYGDAGFKTLQESANKLRAVGNEMLDMLHSAGIISDASFKEIRKNNQFYTPMEAIEHIADNLEKGRYGSGNSYNVASQDVVRAIKDYTGEVGDPIEALVRKIPKVMALVEKNAAIKSLTDMRKQYPSVYRDTIIPVKGDHVPKGMGTINVFENGKNVKYAVPEVIESSIKNLDAETSGILIKTLSIQAKILRAGATGLNIAFIPVNIIRDMQDALTTEFSEKGAKAMLKFLGSYPQAIFEAANKGELYQEWAKSGGLQSTLTEQIFKRTTKTVAEMSGQRSMVKELISSPVKLIEFANRVGEQSTRIARFKAGIESGESNVEAAFRSRDVSIDFAKSGTVIKTFNQAIPFLNVGIQGTEKLVRLYKDNPKGAIIATSVMFGMPTVLLYMLNSRFEDFDDIPRSERENNWILIARDRTQEEIDNGDDVIGFKIPKGFLGRMIANTLDSSMDFMREKDPSTFGEAALSTLSGLSPIGIPYNKQERGRTLSSVLPPWIQATIEGVTNTNLYYGSAIVPRSLQGVSPEEQYRDTTPEVYKKLGKITKQSPLIMENTVNTTTGGLGRQLAELVSGNFVKGTMGQITRRFSGVRGGKKNNKEVDQIFDKITEGKTDSLLKKRAAESLYEEIKGKPREIVKAKILEAAKEDPEVVKRLKDTMEEKALGLTYKERSIKQLGVTNGNRAEYIFEELKKIDSKKAKAAYIKSLYTKKILTGEVIKQLAALAAEEKNSN